MLPPFPRRAPARFGPAPFRRTVRCSAHPSKCVSRASLASVASAPLMLITISARNFDPRNSRARWSIAGSARSVARQGNTSPIGQTRASSVNSVSIWSRCESLSRCNVAIWPNCAKSLTGGPWRAALRRRLHQRCPMQQMKLHPAAARSLVKFPRGSSTTPLRGSAQNDSLNAPDRSRTFGLIVVHFILDLLLHFPGEEWPHKSVEEIAEKHKKRHPFVKNCDDHDRDDDEHKAG